MWSKHQNGFPTQTCLEFARQKPTEKPTNIAPNITQNDDVCVATWVRRWDMWVHLWKHLKPHRCHLRSLLKTDEIDVEIVGDPANQLIVDYNETQASKRGDSQGQSGKYDEIMICTRFFRIVMMAGVEPWSVACQGVLSSWDTGWTCCLPTNRKSSLRSISHALRFELSACYVALRCTQENHVHVNTKNLTFHDPWDQGCAETPRVKTWLHTLIMGAGRCGNMSCCYVFFSAVSFILDNKIEGTKQRLQRQRHAVQRDCSLDLRLRSVVKWLPRYFSIAFEHYDFHRFSGFFCQEYLKIWNIET